MTKFGCSQIGCPLSHNGYYLVGIYFKANTFQLNSDNEKHFVPKTASSSFLLLFFCVIYEIFPYFKL